MLKTFYWKTFLRFCAISLVAMLTLLSIYFAFVYEKPQSPRNHPMFTSYASACVSIYEYGGPKSLLDWVTRLEEERHIKIYLLDADKEDVLNRPLPPEIINAMQGHSSWRDSLPHQFKRETRNGQKQKIVFTNIISKQGNYYTVITELPLLVKTNQLSVHTAQKWGLKLFFAIGIGGLICVWITWYLTKPVNKLRAATQAWGSGNLSARVDESMDNRQDSISQLGRDLNKMAEKLQTLVEGQKRLLRDISHELRTPLARLQIALGLARQRNPDMQQTELNRIELEAERLNEMIGQILSLAQLDTITEIEEKEECDIQTILSTIISNAEFENARAHKSIQLQVEKLEKKLFANVNLIYRALENVIRNALRYTPEDTAIMIHVSEKANQLEITVRDFGPGVPENTLEKLFEPFFRVADARERNTGGYGLGLTIVKRAIELHHGHVYASNATDGGLIITILLPLQ